MAEKPSKKALFSSVAATAMGAAMTASAMAAPSQNPALPNWDTYKPGDNTNHMQRVQPNRTHHERMHQSPMVAPQHETSDAEKFGMGCLSIAVLGIGAKKLCRMASRTGREQSDALNQETREDYINLNQTRRHR